MGELVNHVEHAVLPPVMGSILDQVVRPDVIVALRPKTDARSVTEPQTAAFGLLLWNLQPLTPPDPLDPLVINDPACLIPQHPGNLAVAVPAISASQFDDVGGQPLLVLAVFWLLALRRAVLSESRTGPALRHMKLTSNMLDAGTAACGA
jgi:hypothetical protein